MSEPTTAPRRWASELAAGITLYLRPRVLIVLLLGFSAGLPLALSGETLRLWLADSGVDLGTIGLLTLAGLPYTIKFLWAPVVDALDVPWLSARLGRRRAWLLATQVTLMAAIAFLGTRDAITAPVSVGLAALVVAFASATQDIVIDAYRIESLAPHEQAAGMASYVAAYRIGALVSAGGVTALTEWLEVLGIDKMRAWSIGYAIAALLMLVGMVASLLARPGRGTPTLGAAPAALGRVLATAHGAFADILAQRDAFVVLALVILYKLCDALAGAMTGPFVLALGYHKATYAAVGNGVGLAALLIGGFAGGAVARALSLDGALWLGALLQMLSNLGFVWLNAQIVSPWALTVAIVIENFSGAMGTVFFVAYLSRLCHNPLHTATQYALLTALASTGRTVLSAGTGYLAALAGWPGFFLLTTLAAVPALIVLAVLQRRGHFAELADARPASGA
ncbi:MAG TPA: MFS transporter [Hyphomicrobiaceae bacterium]|nr:MFS transporter [Hyphomicrobiaceae bacterium]